MSRKAVFLGMATIDFIGTVRHLPAPDEVFELDRFDVQGGGPAATASVAYSRLGGHAQFIGATGTDQLSHTIRQGLEDEGVDVSLLSQDASGKSPQAIILVDRTSGSRSIMYQRGTARPPGFNRDLAATIETAGALHLDGFHTNLAIDAARHARSIGVPVSLDGGAGDPWPGLDELLPLIDWLVVARAFAQRQTGLADPEAAARELHADTVVITDGANGAWYRRGSSAGHVPAYRVEVQDTTGAGDVFHGAFVHAKLTGMNLPDAVRFASATAALKCRQLGGRAGIPSLTEVNQFITRQAAH